MGKGLHWILVDIAEVEWAGFVTEAWIADSLESVFPWFSIWR